MLNAKKIGLGVIITVVCGLSGAASAQTAPQNTVVIHASSVQSNEIVQAQPAKTVRRYKTKRVVEALPSQAVRMKASAGNVYGQKFYAQSSSQPAPTRFIYNDGKAKIQTPVYFSVDSMKSR